eukprot:7512721-Lingulodinium_polyedra.AAC.1
MGTCKGQREQLPHCNRGRAIACLGAGRTADAADEIGAFGVKPFCSTRAGLNAPSDSAINARAATAM